MCGCFYLPDVCFFVSDFFGIDEVDVSQKFKVSQVGGFVLVVDFAVADASIRFVEYFFKFPVGNRVVDKSGEIIVTCLDAAFEKIKKEGERKEGQALAQGA